MNRRRRNIALIGAATVLLSGLAIATPTQAEPDDPAVVDAPALVDLGARQASADTETATASRKIDVDTSLLVEGEANTVSLDVGTDDLVLDLEPVASGAPGWSTWGGTVDGAEASSVTLIRKGEEVAGLITSTDGTFRIRSNGEGEQVLQRVETEMFVESVDDDPAPPSSPSGDPAPAPAPGPTAGDEAPEAAADLPSYPEIRVLVGYTPNALSQAGSLSAINSEAAAAISVSNTAYANSGVAGRLVLAGVTAVSNNFGPDTSSLAQLWNKSDGTSDSIHTTRNSTGADLVTVLSNQGGACGIGYVLNTLSSTAGEDAGFSITEFDCAVDNLSFPHELGHNMGLEHDHYVEDSWSLFNYAFGYVNTAGPWRTIMAYNDQCADLSTPVFCTRIGRFSNPNSTYNGAPTGRAYNGSDPADNRRALNNSQATVALFRSRPLPFSSWTRFVQQQWRDFGKATNSSQQSNDANALNNGLAVPSSYVALLMKGSTFGAYYEPVARLYFAYFQRPPDRGGLDYWVGRRKNGTTLNQISSSFAASSEFQFYYGSLSNQGFVELIYDNVLGRTPDAGGLSYWTGQLNSKKKTRGQVMTGFSESSEYKRVRASEINVVLLYRGLLGRGATPDELDDGVSRLNGGTTLDRLILEIMDSDEYADRATL